MQVVMWIVAFIVMVLTIFWIGKVNTNGETTTDAYSKFGVPIIIMIVGTIFVFLNIFFLLINDYCYEGTYKCLYFFVPFTFLIFLFLGVLLPCYTLEMAET